MAVLAGLVALVALIPTSSRSVRAIPRPAEWSHPADTQDQQPAPAVATPEAAPVLAGVDA